MPPGGDGFYYFSVYLRVHGVIEAAFDVEINGQLLCTAYSDLTESPLTDSEITSCSGVTYAVQGISTSYSLKCFVLLSFKMFNNHIFNFVGDTVQVVYRVGLDTTPLQASSEYYYHGFTGFRI